MGEREAIERVDEPVTVESLVRDLRELGVPPDEPLVVHTSLSSMGWVAGGPQAVVDALTRRVDAAVLVPTHTSQYSDPDDWTRPPVPGGWPPIIRESMPPYRPDVTPSRGVGAVPECLRGYPGAVRSRHPLYSVAALGGDAAALVADHELDCGLGERSPLARLCDRGGNVLLLGVGHEVNTTLHLAEHRAGVAGDTFPRSAPILADGERTTVSFVDRPTATDDFPDCGAAAERSVGARDGTVGAAEATLLDAPSLVEFAVEWFREHREWRPPRS